MIANTLRLLALATLIVPALIDPAAAQTPSADDGTFVGKAIVGNTFEIEESKLALQRASDPRLKQFAQKMIDDHTDALNKLEQASGKSGGAAAVALDKPHQAMLDNLTGFNGADFDKIYQADQVASHAETVALLSDYVQNGQNSDLKSWARTALPIVKNHRAAIDAM